MPAIIRKPDTLQKLEILSGDAKYDLACACGKGDIGRRRGSEGNWIYPVTLPTGGSTVLFRTLVSNQCTNDCKYCPLREDMDTPRCSLSPEQAAQAFWNYYSRGKVFGLFLSSGVSGSADSAMQRLISTAEILRRYYQFRGYIHLKIIPGASAAAIEKAVSVSSAVSLNIETPGETNFTKLSEKKNYIKDIIEPIKQISTLTAKGSKFSKVKQTTQFIVGAAGESDLEIVRYMGGLYERLNMHRIFFSAYQKGLGEISLPGEKAELRNKQDTFTREHRLYQVDYLLRKYGFAAGEIEYDTNGSLSLSKDPKETWALKHPDFFPVNINTDDKFKLLRVPGLGHITVSKIVKARRQAKVRRLEDIAKSTALLRKAEKYIKF